MKISKVNGLNCNGNIFINKDWVLINYTDTNNTIKPISGQIQMIGTKYLWISIADKVDKRGAGEYEQEGRKIEIKDIVYMEDSPEHYYHCEESK